MKGWDLHAVLAIIGLPTHLRGEDRMKKLDVTLATEKKKPVNPPPPPPDKTERRGGRPSKKK
jgi:hypothetical protein